MKFIKIKKHFRKNFLYFILLSFLNNPTLVFSSAAPVVLSPISYAPAPREIFQPSFGQHGMVVSQDPLATQIGIEVLKKGGNAIDAAIAVAYALAVTLPRAGNIAGGGFMLIWLGKEQKAIGVNYRETAPLLATPQRFLINGKVNGNSLRDSYLSCGIPGTVAGLELARTHFGTLSRAQLMTPAIILAEQGFAVSYTLAQSLAAGSPRLKRFSETRKIFYKKNGSFYQTGEILRQPELAHTLKRIALHGTDAFYRGEIAHDIVHAMKMHGGLIQAQDLIHYHARIIQPIIGNFKEYRVIVLPPPSSGIILLEMLNILEKIPLVEYGLNSARYIHYLVETMNLAYNDRNEYLGDPLFINIPIAKLTDKNYAAQLRSQITENHRSAQEINSIKGVMTEHPETTHFVVIDKNGNIVSNTYTLNGPYGSAQVIPHTGMLLNNELDDFTVEVGAVNAYGLKQGTNNLIAPGKQPLSSMSPVIVLDVHHKPILASGSPGGSQITTTILQVLLNVLIHHLNIADAVSQPRIHSQLWPDEIRIEAGISPDTVQLLQQQGHRIKRGSVMGMANSLSIDPKAYYGGADPRRGESAALGY